MTSETRSLKSAQKDKRLVLSSLVAVVANVIIVILLSGFTAPVEKKPVPRMKIQRIQMQEHKQVTVEKEITQADPEMQTTQQLPPLPQLPTVHTNHVYTLPNNLYTQQQNFTWSSNFSVGRLDFTQDAGAIVVDRRARRKYSPDLGRFYPRRAKRKLIQGFSHVRLFIDEQGMVDHFEIVDSQPLGVFDEAIGRFIKQVRYEPAIKNGKISEDVLQATFKWSLE
ncbi:MAG: TonB family protein [Planctomycetes bacterium]|nr:TonB family protein [Planctomycetota bacterium]